MWTRAEGDEEQLVLFKWVATFLPSLLPSFLPSFLPLRPSLTTQPKLVLKLQSSCLGFRELRNQMCAQLEGILELR